MFILVTIDKVNAHVKRRIKFFFSSPEPKAMVKAGSVVRPSSVVRLSIHNVNDSSSETTKPIATKFHIQPPGSLGKKKCSNGLGHMTNMAAMPRYGKSL